MAYQYDDDIQTVAVYLDHRGMMPSGLVHSVQMMFRSVFMDRLERISRDSGRGFW